jgi:hypothetical protein
MTFSMNSTGSAPTAPAACTSPDEPVRIRAHHSVVKKLGDWTTSRRFDIRASAGVVVVDLLLPRIEAGDIEIFLDIDHATVKLLVPDGVHVDDDELRRNGRGRVKDWTGAAAPGGRRIRLLGELRRAEVRVHRGGIAIVSLLLYGQGREVRQAQRAGLLGGISRPGR